MIIANALLDGRLSDITVRDGIITAVEPAGGGAAVDCAGNLDAGGRIVIPGMIDPHVHLRSPGMEEKEDWVTGSLAAAAGGVTTVIDMPNTKPAAETPEALELKRAAAEKADSTGAPLSRLFWAGCSPDTVDMLPWLLAEHDIAGVKLFFSESSANASSSDIGFISRVFAIAAEAGKPAAVHSELAALMLADAGGADDPPLVRHNHRRPAAAAVAGTALALELAAVAGCSLYLCHLSTMAEFAMVRKHKDAYGSASVVAELTPHHLLLDENHIVSGGYQSWAKVNPPLRAETDRKAAAEALINGTIDLIGSDHAPHRPAEKDMRERDFHDCPSGFPGLETELGLIAGFIKEQAGQAGKSDAWIEALTRLTSRRAAEIFGLEDRAVVAVGKRADLVILGGAGRIESDKFKSKAKYSPFNGMKTDITVYKTISGGKIIGQ